MKAVHNDAAWDTWDAGHTGESWQDPPWYAADTSEDMIWGDLWNDLWQTTPGSTDPFADYP